LRAIAVAPSRLIGRPILCAAASRLASAVTAHVDVEFLHAHILLRQALAERRQVI
jgi:hypothetical protein